jgi:hypothetical protein
MAAAGSASHCRDVEHGRRDVAGDPQAWFEGWRKVGGEKTRAAAHFEHAGRGGRAGGDHILRQGPRDAPLSVRDLVVGARGGGETAAYDLCARHGVSVWIASRINAAHACGAVSGDR